jgi:hypothetical protein
MTKVLLSPLRLHYLLFWSVYWTNLLISVNTYLQCDLFSYSNYKIILEFWYLSSLLFWIYCCLSFYNFWGVFSLFLSKVQQSLPLCPCFPQTLHLPLNCPDAAKAVSGVFPFEVP